MKIIGAIALWVGLLGVGQANAVTLFNSTAGTSAFTEPVKNDGPLYASFSTGASAFSLTALILLLGAEQPTDGGTFTLSLLSDNSTSPGSVIDTVTGSDSILTKSIEGIETTGSDTLLANTRYWIELSGTGSVFWSVTADLTGTEVATEFNDDLNGVVPNPPYGDFQMEIFGDNIATSATPLPGTLPLFASGLGFLIYLAKRRKRNAALAAA